MSDEDITFIMAITPKMSDELSVMSTANVKKIPNKFFLNNYF